MTEKAFFVNYGSLAHPEKGTTPPELDFCLVEKKDSHYQPIIEALTKANEQYYCQVKVFRAIFQPLRFTTQAFQVGAITVTVHQYGITHRAVEINLNDNNNKEDQIRFEKALLIAQEITRQKYAALSNNCVTAVSMVLHTLDPSITPDDLILPSALDEKVADYANKFWLRKPK